PVSVFLKIDAGFGRVGAPLPVAASEAREIARLPSVTLAGLFTHLPFFSEESVAWVQERLKAFGEVAGTIQGDAGRRLVVQALAFSHSILVRKPGQRVGIAGRSAPVLSVSLEHTVIDVTDATPIAEGATVHLLSRDGAVGPTLEDIARAQDRATVEILVALTGKAAYAYVS